MRNSRIVSAALSALLLIGSILPTPVFAWPNGLEGQPEGGDPERRAAFYVWYDENGLRLRTNGPGPRHLFRGRLTTDGSFQNAQLVRLEGDDGFEVIDNGQTLMLRFETSISIDGLDFQIQDGTYVRLELTIDDQLAPPQRIFYGKDKRNPIENPFVLYR